MKKRGTVCVLCAGASLLLLCVCRQAGQKENLAAVGSTIITSEEMDAFSTVSRYMPQQAGDFALATRATGTAMVETEAIYKKARWNLRNFTIRRSLDWRWKERYFISLVYSNNILQSNLGYSDNQLKSYYRAHRNEFKEAIVKYDSAGKKPCSSLVVRPFGEVKMQAAEKMFWAEHKPDSLFKIRAGTTDTAQLRVRWIDFMRGNGYRDFFMKEYFQQKYGKRFPDSLKDLYGKGKPVDTSDMNIILSWIPEGRRDQIKNSPQGLMDFCGWLMKWRLFSEQAIKAGYAGQPVVRKALKWAWMLEIAQRYVDEKLAPAAKKGVTIDSAMALYSYWDESGNPGKIDSVQLKNTYANLIQQGVTVKFDSLIYGIRREMRVRFIRPGWGDEKTKDPVAILRKADSLRDTGNSNEAQNNYRVLVQDFPFTKEGKKALVELAKIQTEQQSYSGAIQNYRRFLVIDADKSKRCNTMFMIGFIYDEYLDKPDMAEANYKWVLKNAPECELVDDAEFMMAHLGEQMSSVEELQAEVRRQGKKVEASPADSAGGAPPAQKTAIR